MLENGWVTDSLNMIYYDLIINSWAVLLTLIFHFSLEEICLKEVTSIADSIYNIQLLREFSNEYLNKCFYLTLEDMLYAPLVLKVRYVKKHMV